MKVAIFGASGFVGTALVKRLRLRPEIEVVPIIRSSATAWELSRHAIPMTSVDILRPDAVRAALKGVTHVVNCTRGNDQVMFEGLKNLLAASKDQGVSRFVHLSSVAVYGDPPPPESVFEDAPTNPEKGSYGWIKLIQDRMVADAHAKGLPTVILCPPNISGPGSVFVMQVLRAMKEQRFALMDHGDAVCALVDVTNLAAAIEASLHAENTDSGRHFITDDEPTTWSDLVRDLSTCLGPQATVPSIERAKLAHLVEQANRSAMPKGSLIRSAKHLVSSDVRAALREDPWIANADRFVRGLVGKLPELVEARLRFAIAGPSVEIPRPMGHTNLDVRLTGQQLRGVRHSCEKAKRDLGYRPIVSYAASMCAFRKWYATMHGVSTPDTELLAELGL